MTMPLPQKWPRDMVSPDALMDQARGARLHAYAPYSRFPVGAALLLTDGTVVLGCNVENASYGLTSCAERNAVGQMVIRGFLRPWAVAVAGPEGEPCFPCGACRQVLSEFNPELLVVVEHRDRLEVISLEDLLPRSFGPRDLEAH